MPSVVMVDQNNKKVKDVELPGLFGSEVRPHLMHAAVVNQLANRRAGTACDEEQGAGERWRKKTLEAEGHRTGPRGKQPVTAVEAWRYLFRSNAARLLLFVAEEGKAGSAR